MELPVPDGRIHRDELLQRGWSHDQLALLSDKVKIPVPDATISPVTYLEAEVQHIEATNTRVKAAVTATQKAQAALMPRRPGGYTRDETLPRSVLIKQGWTDAHIKRLLGDPDHIDHNIRGGRLVASHRWAIERVNHAAATDQKLQKRLEQVTQKRRAEKEQRITTTVENGTAVWRRHGDSWVAQGRGFDEGDLITITRRNGETARHRVERIIEDHEGLLLAAVSRHPITTPPTPTPKPEPEIETVETPRRQLPETILTTRHAPTPGDITHHDGHWIQIQSVRKHWISDDDPSLYGSHLLGWEGDQGWLITYHDAPGDVVAEREAAAAAERAARQERIDWATAYREIAHHITTAGEQPPGPIELDGERLIDQQTLDGGGDWFEITANHIWYIRNNGMDGDTWSINNITTSGAGAIGTRIPLDDHLATQLRDLTRQGHQHGWLPQPTHNNHTPRDERPLIERIKDIAATTRNHTPPSHTTPPPVHEQPTLEIEL